MTFLSQPAVEQRQREQIAALTPGDPDAFKPGFFEGAATGAAFGVARFGATLSQAIDAGIFYAAVQPATIALDGLFDTNYWEQAEHALIQSPREVTASMTPDPQTTGTSGKILYGLTGLGLPAAGGAVFGGPGGAALAAGGSDALGTYSDLFEQGVDADTATAAALWSGTLTGVGVALPGSLGARVSVSTLVYGPGINVAQDIVAMQGTSAILEARGYDELAGHYGELDTETLIADAVLGAAFGYTGARYAAGRVPRETNRMPMTGEIDAALAAMDRQQVEVDLAPGLAADAAALESHLFHLRDATEALLDGRRPDAAPLDGTFADKPADPAFADDALAAAFRDSGYAEIRGELEGLEVEMAKRGLVDPDAPLPPAPGRAVVSDLLDEAPAIATVDDVVRAAELDAENFGLPAPPRTIPDDDPILVGRENDVSPERVALRETLIAERFTGLAGGHAKPVALVMGGGGASGKGTVLGALHKAGAVPPGAVELDPDAFKTGNKRRGWAGLPEYWSIAERGDARAAAVVHEESSLLYRQALQRAVDGRFDLVLDRTLGDPVKAAAELQALKDAGYEIHLVGVTVKPETAVARAVERAKGPEKRFVPLHHLLAAHKGFAQGFDNLSTIAARALLLDNEVPKGSPPLPLAGRSGGKPLTVIDAEGYTRFNEKGALNDQAKTLRELAGARPSPGKAEQGDGGRAADNGGTPGRGGDRAGPGRAGERAKSDDDLSARLADQALEASPELSIIGPDGSRMSGAVALRASREYAAVAQRESVSFEAAVSCFLRSAA